MAIIAAFAFRGIIVQEVNGFDTTIDGTQTISMPYHYWEAWKVSPGKQTADPTPQDSSDYDDTFADNNSAKPNHSGSDTVTTTTIFYEGYRIA